MHVYMVEQITEPPYLWHVILEWCKFGSCFLYNFSMLAYKFDQRILNAQGLFTDF